MYRTLNGLLVLLLTLVSLTDRVQAIQADWAEEMELDPTDVNWSKNAADVVTTGTSWIVADDLLGYNLQNPAIDTATYTYEFRVRLLDPVLTANNPGRAWPIWVYMGWFADENGGGNRMGRSLAAYGIEDGEFAYVMDKPYSKYPVTVSNQRQALQLAEDEWYTIRVIQDQTANTTTMYVNGSPLYLDYPNTNSVWRTGAGGFNTEDDRLLLGSGETLPGSQTEWDYLRIARSAVPINVPLEAIGGGCNGNLNGDGTTDGADVAIVYNAWNTNNALADINNDGTVDGADLGAVFNCWNQADAHGVPEPASPGMLGLGLAGLLAARRRV